MKKTYEGELFFYDGHMYLNNKRLSNLLAYDICRDETDSTCLGAVRITIEAIKQKK